MDNEVLTNFYAALWLPAAGKFREEVEIDLANNPLATEETHPLGIMMKGMEMHAGRPVRISLFPFYEPTNARPVLGTPTDKRIVVNFLFKIISADDNSLWGLDCLLKPEIIVAMTAEARILYADILAGLFEFDAYEDEPLAQLISGA